LRAYNKHVNELFKISDALCLRQGAFFRLLYQESTNQRKAGKNFEGLTGLNYKKRTETS